MNIVEEIKNYVEEECNKETNIFKSAYDHHFISVVEYAKEMAREVGADVEIVELAAWLHDIASIQGNYENHHLAGAEIAEKILLDHNYPMEKIEKIKHCIIAHRASKDIPRETIETECVADADAMSHFDNIGALFYLAMITRKLSIEDAEEFVKSKLERSWDKLTPRAKEIILPKYEAMKILLE